MTDVVLFLKQASTAKYIIQQYIAATGGQTALASVSSMYAVGKLKMSASEFHVGNQTVAAKRKGEIGGYVLWQKNPGVWYFELIMAGSKMSAGSDGKVAWRQSASEQSHASRGPPRPLRRSLQVFSSLTVNPREKIARLDLNRFPFVLMFSAGLGSKVNGHPLLGRGLHW